MKWTVPIALFPILIGCAHRVQYTLQVKFEPRPIPGAVPAMGESPGPPAIAQLTWKGGKRVVRFPGFNESHTIDADIPALPFDKFTFYEFQVEVTKDGYKTWNATYDSGNFVWDNHLPPGRRIDVIHLEPAESKDQSTRESGAPNPGGDTQ